MSETQVPVVISGAGPNGLMVACELALAGVRPLVLERLPAPSDEPKANGMVGQVIRMLDMRGLYQKFTGSDDPPHPAYQWIFSGMSVPLFGVRDNPMYALMRRNRGLCGCLTSAHVNSVSTSAGPTS